MTGRIGKYLLTATAIAALATAVMSPEPARYIIPLLLLPLAVLVLRAAGPGDRLFYLPCAGILLVIACGIVHVIAGLVVAWAVAGLCLHAWGMLDSPADLRGWAIFCAALAIAAIVIALSNHVLLPFLVILGTAGAAFLIQSLHNHRVRKQLRGALP